MLCDIIYIPMAFPPPNQQCQST